MSGTSRQPGPAATDNATSSMSAVLHELNRRAEAMLASLRDYPAHLVRQQDHGHLQGEEQLRELRAAMPRRRLTASEGLRIAERQAALLRWQLGVEGLPALTTELLTDLPFVTVTYRERLAKSGLATKTARGWVIVLRADEPSVRQRFSLGHEIKHTIDDELLTQFPEGLYCTWGGRSGEGLAERVCDHFAACLLMPKLLLRRDWTSGTQEPARLARRYQVSNTAMDVRLRTLGLIEPTPRCGRGAGLAA
jgi:Zn-dependent peptidase ImmA (M78 family)